MSVYHCDTITASHQCTSHIYIGIEAAIELVDIMMSSWKNKKCSYPDSSCIDVNVLIASD